MNAGWVIKAVPFWSLATAVNVCVPPVASVALAGETAMLVSTDGLTVSAVVCRAPAVVAVTVTNVDAETAVVVTGNGAVTFMPLVRLGERTEPAVPPALTVTLAGTTTAGLLLESETTTLLPGCIPRTCTLPAAAFPPTKLAGLTSTDDRPVVGARNTKEIFAVSVTAL